jgi:hypothetical protein
VIRTFPLAITQHLCDKNRFAGGRHSLIDGFRTLGVTHIQRPELNVQLPA